MDKKVILEDAIDSNPRGDQISEQEILQTLFDMGEWFKSQAKSVANKIHIAGPASQQEMEKLDKCLQFQSPLSFKKLQLFSNGSFQLQESYVTMSISSIIDTREDLNIYGTWNKSYLPFAKDMDDNYLIINNDNQKVIAWNRDQGVTEEISDNLGLLLESLRNSVLEHKFEYIDDCGLVEKI